MVGNTPTEPPERLIRHPLLAPMFLSFLYAAATVILMTEFIKGASFRLWPGLLLINMIVLFLAIDWIARVRARDYIRDASAGSFAALLGVDVISVVFLILFFSQLIIYGVPHRWAVPRREWQEMTPFVPLLFFLFSSFCWNLLVVRIIRPLKVPTLYRATMMGQVHKTSELLTYMPRLSHISDVLERKVNEIALKKPRLGSFLIIGLDLLKAFVYSFTHGVALHVCCLNIIAFLVILFLPSQMSTWFTAAVAFAFNWWLLMPIAVVATLLFLSKSTSPFAAALLIVAITIVYLSLTPEFLAYLILIQQIGVSVFFLVMAEVAGPGHAPDERLSGANA